MAISGERSASSIPGPLNASRTQSWQARESKTLFLASRFATSQTEIADIKRSLVKLAARIFSRQLGESFPGVASASQNQTWVSSSSAPSLIPVRVPNLACRPHNVTKDGDCAFHVAENIPLFLLVRNKLGNRLAALGNDDLTVAVLDLIHQLQALRLEAAGRYRGRFFQRLLGCVHM